MTERPVLVDSSLWIDFYRPDGRAERRDPVRDALVEDRVATTGIIVIEVLRGAADVRQLRALRADFTALHWLEGGRRVAEEGARMGYEIRRRGRPVPATDLWIAAAAVHHRCELWHDDVHFEAIAEVTELRQRRFGPG